ncbi:MAG: hypothetical protein IT381_16525 [Deltaproteobacteria bacterium]|nr:hypothetical protein [Deltaproteobacteria bacterium]
MRKLRAPPARDSFSDALAEAEEWGGRTFGDHNRGFLVALDLAFAALSGNPDKQRLLDAVDPLPAESVALIERLRRQRAERHR